jgi:putative resolvase
MKAYLRTGEAAVYLGVCTKTIRRWDKAGKIACKRTPKGHRRIALVTIESILEGKIPKELTKSTAVYCRVASHEQKKKGD